MKKRVLLAVLCLLSMAHLEARAQAPASTDSVVTVTDKEQHEIGDAMREARVTDLEIQIRELQVKVAGYEKDQFTNRRAAWINAFKGKIEDIRKAHKWAHDVYFDPDTQSFRRMATVNADSEAKAPIKESDVKTPTKKPEPSKPEIPSTGQVPVAALKK